MFTNNRNRRNYRILTFANAVAAVFTGLGIPFFLIFFFEFGGKPSVFATAVAVQGICAAIVSYYAGKLSDSIGRKPLLIASSLVGGLCVILYALISEVWQLYALQALAGVTAAVYALSERVFLADITQKASRGADIGRYIMILGVLSSVFTIVGGFLVGIITFKAAFVILGTVYALDTIPLFLLTEERKK